MCRDRAVQNVQEQNVQSTSSILGANISSASRTSSNPNAGNPSLGGNPRHAGIDCVGISFSCDDEAQRTTNFLRQNERGRGELDIHGVSIL